jgi:N-acetylglucosamine-6-phosphate deacetylase
MATALHGARIFTGERTLEGHALVLEGATISALLPTEELPAGTERVELPAEALLAPGFIDLQVNGAGGVLFNEEPTPEAAVAIAAALRRGGTTALLPTFITDEAPKQQRASEAALEALQRPGSGVLGLHLEGPFIGSERPGVHHPSFIRAPSPRDLEELCSLASRLRAGGGRLLVTLAPETVEDAAIAQLAGAGVVLAAGHTGASFERTASAVQRGVQGFTHLFNAMPPISNRQPGPVAAALESDAWCSVIADGVHVHPALLRLVLKLKRAGRVILVTDAMPPVGTDATTFQLYGQTIFRREGRLVTENGTLAGADVDMISSVRNCVRLLELPLEESLRMASAYPAACLGLTDRGRLHPGLLADLVLLTPDLAVESTWVGGVRS